ncbi:MAG: hypothetical protein ACKO50_10325, partial [Cyanobium sp.]
AERKLTGQDAVIDKNRAQLEQAEVDRRRTIRSTARANLDEAEAERQTLQAETEWLNRDTRQQKQALIRWCCSATTACCSTPARSATPGRCRRRCDATASTRRSCAACGR